MLPLSRTTFDHTPCKIQIGTAIPKAKIFIFENFWVEQSWFLDIVQFVWQTKVKATNSATRVVAKFKHLRRVLKKWALGLSKMKILIKQCDAVLAVLDKLEENMVLYPPEQNFRKILKTHILKLLQSQNEYWKKRYTVRWTKLGDESTKFFHAAATEHYRINTITSLIIEEGRIIFDHQGKVSLLW
jgi:hypothetical protein